jgi:hypothetical protein
VIYNPLRDNECISSMHNFCRGKKKSLHQFHALKWKYAKRIMEVHTTPDPYTTCQKDASVPINDYD